MNIVFILVMVLELIVSVALVAVILMQSKNASGITGSITGMGASQSYWDKNKGRSLEGQLEKYTRICAAIFMILAFVINFIK